MRLRDSQYVERLLYYDYDQFKLAMQGWDRNRQVFEQNETARLEELKAPHLNFEIESAAALTIPYGTTDWAKAQNALADVACGPL